MSAAAEVVLPPAAGPGRGVTLGAPRRLSSRPHGRRPGALSSSLTISWPPMGERFDATRGRPMRKWLEVRSESAEEWLER